MKNIYKLLLGCVVAAGFAFPAAAQISLSLSANSQTNSVGGFDTYSLIISGLKGNVDLNGPALGGYQVTLDYNSSIASLSADTFGTKLSNSGPDYQYDSSSPGVIQLSEMSYDLPALLESSQTASFTLATFTLQGIAPGRTALSFDLANTSLSDENGSSLDLINANSGAFTVTAVPEPGTYALAALGLGCVVLHRRWIRGNAKA